MFAWLLLFLSVCPRGRRKTEALWGLGLAAVSAALYALFGFDVMYPGNDWLVVGVIGGATPLSIFRISESLGPYGGAYVYWADLLVQCQVSATVALALFFGSEAQGGPRTRAIFAVIVSSLFYPLVGSWKWGGGWLDNWGAHDFNGGLLVYWFSASACFGAALRRGVRGVRSAEPSTRLAALAVSLVIFSLAGAGANAGSVLGEASATLPAVNLATAAAAGALGALMVGVARKSSTKAHEGCIGAMAGLVSLSAAADLVSPGVSFAIGLVTGSTSVVVAAALQRRDAQDPGLVFSMLLPAGLLGSLAPLAGGTPSVPQVVAVVVVGGVGLVVGGALGRAMLRPQNAADARSDE